MAADEREYMLRALALAREAWGRTAPNPMVGAVVVKAGRIVGEGFHHGAGTPHAEINALRDAGDEARGATIYVTMEPCCTYGRTPPCTEALKAAGIKRVVAAGTDVNPRHAGRGFAILREAGIEVEVGLCEAEANELNKAFFHHITTGRPYVLLKMAMTLDGKIATASGDSKWITGEAARRRVQELRRWSDAIMVGGETARLDHPRLTVREPENWPCQPLKCLYSRMSAEQVAQLFPGENVIVAAPQNHAKWLDFLTGLGRQNVMALLLEGGGELAGAALQSGIVDEVEFHVAPKILGGRESRPAVGGKNPLTLAEALNLEPFSVQKLGEELIISAKVKR